MNYNHAQWPLRLRCVDQVQKQKDKFGPNHAGTVLVFSNPMLTKLLFVEVAGPEKRQSVAVLTMAHAFNIVQLQLFKYSSSAPRNFLISVSFSTKAVLHLPTLPQHNHWLAQPCTETSNETSPEKNTTILKIHPFPSETERNFEVNWKPPVLNSCSNRGQALLTLARSANLDLQNSTDVIRPNLVGPMKCSFLTAYSPPRTGALCQALPGCPTEMPLRGHAGGLGVLGPGEISPRFWSKNRATIWQLKIRIWRHLIWK